MLYWIALFTSILKLLLFGDIQKNAEKTTFPMSSILAEILATKNQKSVTRFKASVLSIQIYSQVQVLHNINIFIYYSVVVFMSQNIWLFVHDSKAFCSVLLSPSLPIFLAYLVLRCRDKITQINVPLLRKAATFASKTKHTRLLEHALGKETKPIAFLNQIKVNQLGTKTILWLMLLVEL